MRHDAPILCFYPGSVLWTVVYMYGAVPIGGSRLSGPACRTVRIDATTSLGVHRGRIIVVTSTEVLPMG